jgi:drug/metabolite transporter (DMT)-like permease
VSSGGLGIAFGLGAALSWGLADYFAALASRRVGALRVVLGFHLAAIVPLAALAFATNALAPLSWSQVPFFVLLGAVGWLSYLAFYGALAIGPISVLSPIVSGYAAVTVLLAVVISGERLDVGATVAVVVTIAGVVVCSTDLRQIRGIALERRAALGLLLALAAMALIGGFVFGVAYRHRVLGWLAPIFLARGFATLFLLGHGALQGLRWPEGSVGLLGVVGLLGILDTGGYVCFNLGVEHAATSIVATASAPYALVPIAAGVLLLAERPTLMQRAGVLLVIGGLVLLGLTR